MDELLFCPLAQSGVSRRLRGGLRASGVRRGAAKLGLWVAALRCDEGQSLIEFAVCLPILLLIVTGILGFGVTLNNYVMLTDAVGIGARRLAVARDHGSDPCGDASSAVYSAAPFLAQANLSFTFVVNGSTYTGPNCSSAGSLLQSSTAQVQVSYPCTLRVYGMNFGPNCTLRAQTTEVIQ